MFQIGSCTVCPPLMVDSRKVSFDETLTGYHAQIFSTLTRYYMHCLRVLAATFAKKKFSFPKRNVQQMGKNIKAVQNIEVTGLWAIKQWEGEPRCKSGEGRCRRGKMGNGGRQQISLSVKHIVVGLAGWQCT